MMHSTETGSSTPAHPVGAGSNSTHRSSKSKGKRVAAKSRRHHSGASKSIRKRHQKKNGKNSRAPAFKPKTFKEYINGQKALISTDLSAISSSACGPVSAFAHKREFYFFDTGLTGYNSSYGYIGYGVPFGKICYPVKTLKEVYDMSRKGYSLSLQPKSAKLLSEQFGSASASASTLPRPVSPLHEFWNTVMSATPSPLGNGAGPSSPIDLFSDSSDDESSLAPVQPVVPSVVSGMNVEVSAIAEKDDSARECAICLDHSVESNSNPKLFSECGHVTCSPCFGKYVRKNIGQSGDFNCPTCRKLAKVESIVTVRASVKKCVGCSATHDAESCDGIRVLICGHVACRPCSQTNSITVAPVFPGQFGADQKLLTICPQCSNAWYGPFNDLCRVNQRLVETIPDPLTTAAEGVSHKGKEAV
jgi:hypothetical protein